MDASFTFQLTSSHGGWRFSNCFPTSPDIFQLTSSHGGWPSAKIESLNSQVFQLTSSHGGWPAIDFWKMDSLLFNSHPHMEDDVFFSYRVTWKNFSTHILTWRMTFSFPTGLHDRIFQLTSSHGGWRNLLSVNRRYSFFNSHPHKKDDDRKGCRASGVWLFNSHPHMEDDVK